MNLLRKVHMPRGPARADEAVAWLRDALAHGPRLCSELRTEAPLAGIRPKALRTARERLEVVVTRAGYGPAMRSTWQLASIGAEVSNTMVSTVVSTGSESARDGHSAVERPLAAHRENPQKLCGRALRALAHRRGIARSELARMSDEKIREQLRYLVHRQYEMGE